jgi:uncharacterized protein
MTPAFARYIAPARARPEVWRLILGTGFIAAFYVIVIMALAVAVRALGLEGTRGPTATLALLYSFAAMGMGAILAARIFHRRVPATLFGRAAPLIRDFTRCAVLVLVLQGLVLLVVPLPGGLQPGLDPARWLVLLAPALIGLMIQTGAEELVFRGYLQQQLAARFRSPLVWMVLPSVLFGFLHYEPTVMGGNVWHVVAATGMFGLVAADLTARTGNLGAAWGLHFANNLYALLIVTVQGPLEGLALFTMAFPQSDVENLRPLILADMVGLLVLWGLARLVLRR